MKSPTVILRSRRRTRRLLAGIVIGAAFFGAASQPANAAVTASFSNGGAHRLR